MFDRSKLLPWLLATRESIAGDRLDVPDQRGSLIFRDYGADVLLVAHLDWVGELAERLQLPSKRGDIVRHASLDDRLGCWAIEQLHASGVRADLLYTDCEEVGASTGREFAELHAPRDRYKLILMLDRAGTDAVLYQYEDVRAWRRFCARHIGPTAFGSFSCISSMDALGVCAVNVGVGYHDHNGPRCWADLRVAECQMARAATFIAKARKRVWPYRERRFERLNRETANRVRRTFRTSAELDWSEDITSRSALRLCIACSAADGLEHYCPAVADCACCELSDDWGRNAYR